MTGATLAYAAPELLKPNEKYDERIDYWSLGVILFQLLFDKLPFEDESMSQSVQKIRHEELTFKESYW